jgi:two-component system OmpR family sensor kinase
VGSGQRVTGSIRFRLAAWYAAIVLAVIVALGLAFSFLLERELRSDVDARIGATAQRVKKEIEGVYIDPRTGELMQVQVSPPDFYSFPSLLIQVVNTSGTPLISTENLHQVGSLDPRVLPTKSESAGSSEPVFETAKLDGVQIRTVRLPLVISAGGKRTTIGAVNVGEPLIQLEQTLNHVRRLLAIGAVLGAAFAAFSGWWLAGRALRPVDRITATAAAIAGGSGVGKALSARLEVGRSGDELARLSETFNRMLNRLQETFESQQRFIADASHELRTPLTAIQGNVDVLSRQIDRGDTPGIELDETLEDLRRESERMRRLIEELLLLARAEVPPEDDDRRTSVQLEEVVVEAVRVGAALAQGQRIETVAQSPAIVTADRDRLLQVLIILIDNAIRHTPENGVVTVTTAVDRGQATISVQDTGQGIAPEHLRHIFDRFYRADSSRQRGSGGTGLGLAIARAIVESHGGSISVVSRLGEGTTFAFTLPLSPAPLDDAEPVPQIRPHDTQALAGGSSIRR